jgi:hypothetical protein
MQRTYAKTTQNRPGDAVAGLSENVRERDGSTLLIVMVLLGMLSLIGFLFYTFAAQERSSAAYWADAQKNYTAELDPDALFDWSLYQLIVGPDDSLTQTALAGKRHSMLPNIFGRDIHPYNSAGIKLGSLNGQPFVDMNYDNAPDADQAPLQFNDSAPANGGVAARNLAGWPDSGVDYTYPDINNLFLAYKGYAVDVNGNTVPVIIPSFHRPQLLRAAGGTPVLAGGAVGTNWYDYDDTNNPLGLNFRVSGRVLRPHPEHLGGDGVTRRFVSTAFPHATLTPFPFGPDGTNPNRGLQGVWSLTGGVDCRHDATDRVGRRQRRRRDQGRGVARFAVSGADDERGREVRAADLLHHLRRRRAIQPECAREPRRDVEDGGVGAADDNWRNPQSVDAAGALYAIYVQSRFVAVRGESAVCVEQLADDRPGFFRDIDRP